MRGPGIGCWFSDRPNCSCRSFEAAVLPINPNIDTDQWEPFIIYHFIILQTHYQFKLDFPKVDSAYIQKPQGQSAAKHGNSPVEYPGEIEIFKSGSSGTFFFCPLSRVIGENSLSSNSHCHMADAKRGGIFKCRLWENYTTFCHDVSEWFLSLAFSSFWYVGLMTFSISHISKWVNILAFLY